MRVIIFLMKRREVLLLLLIPLSIPLVITMMGREQPCSKQIDVSIGVQSSYPGGWQQSILQLSHEMKKCPKSKKFIIRRRTSWFNGDELRTEYNRNTHVLYDSRFGEGSSYRWLNVNEKMIYEVAASSGGFDDFRKYGCIDGAA